MNRISKRLLFIAGLVAGIGVLWWLWQPFYTKYINSPYPVGSDYTLHLPNLEYFDKHWVFPVKAWQGTWYGGYPVVEGYPWVQYHLMRPLVAKLGGTAQAMESYVIVNLWLYFVMAFGWLFYISRNWLVAMWLSMMLMFGADSGMSLFSGGFIVFASSQWLVPFILWLIHIARDNKSFKWWLVVSLGLAMAFYLHPSITSLMILPLGLPFMVLNKKGKLSEKTIRTTFRVGILTALMAGLMVYQYIDQTLRGPSLMSTRLKLAEAPERLSYILQRPNPLLLVVGGLIVILGILGRKQLKGKMKPYYISFSLLFGLFGLMFFRIGSLDTVFFAEREVWGLSLMLMVILAKLVKEIFSGKRAKMIVSGVGLGLVLVYGYLMIEVKPAGLMPRTLKERYVPGGTGTHHGLGTVVPKYSKGESYPQLDWQKKFDNYRTDGMDYIIYMWASLLSPNTRFKGFFQALKGLPLYWSGVVVNTELGMLEKDVKPELSPTDLNRSLFWLDWYAIRRFQDAASLANFKSEEVEAFYGLASYWKQPPLVEKKELSKDLAYYSLDSKLIGPMYSPTNTARIAMVGGKGQYGNFMRILSYGKHNSQKLIPIYLGGSLKAIKEKDLDNFEAVFLYGYKGGSTGVWRRLNDYVKDGGKLMIDAGQNVSQTSSFSLPEVFPVVRTQSEVITQPWDVDWEKSWLTEGIKDSELRPLNYKYLPFTISKTEGSNQGLREWAKAGLERGEEAVMAYGELGKGKVVWSGLNLPFHAVDNKNVSETVIWENVMNWLFEGKETDKVGEYEVSRPTSEKIVVSGKGAKGVLFKEHYNPGWRAKVNGKRVKIYKAGLLQMYVVIPEGVEDFTVELNYYGAWYHWLILGISLVSLIGVLGYCLTGRNLFRKLYQPSARRN